MIRDRVRRCDLCASEMLGTKGADICYICCLCMDEERGFFIEEWDCDHRELEPFAAMAVPNYATPFPWYFGGWEAPERGADVRFRLHG